MFFKSFKSYGVTSHSPFPAFSLQLFGHLFLEKPCVYPKKHQLPECLWLSERSGTLGSKGKEVLLSVATLAHVLKLLLLRQPGLAWFCSAFTLNTALLCFVTQGHSSAPRPKHIFFFSFFCNAWVGVGEACPFWTVFSFKHLSHDFLGRHDFS